MPPHDFKRPCVRACADAANFPGLRLKWSGSGALEDKVAKCVRAITARAAGAGAVVLLSSHA